MPADPQRPQASPDSGWQDYQAKGDDQGWQDYAPEGNFPATPKQPGILDREIPLSSYPNATLSGLQSIGRGVRGAVQGIGHAIMHPMTTADETVNAVAELPGQIMQVPGAIRDINRSPDPYGTYMKAAQETAGTGAGQALTALGAEAIPRIPRMIPSAARAGRALESVNQVVGANPVGTTATDRAVMDAIIQNERGGGAIPPPMKKYAQLAGGPPGMGINRTAPMTFEEMRDFASNAGRLSARDLGRTSLRMKMTLGQFAKDAAEANRAAAEAAGQGEPYNQAINEYRRAMKMRQLGQNVVTGVKRAALPAALGYTGYRLYNDLMSKR